MNNFISYNTTENLDTIAFKDAIDSGIVQKNGLIELQSSPQDSIDVKTDTIVQSTLNKGNYFNRTDTGFINEIKQSESNLPVNVRNNQNSDWLTIVLLAAFVLLVSVRAGFQKYIGTLFQSVVNYSTSFRMFNEKNYSFLHGAFRLEVLYYIIFSVFVYQVQAMQHFESANHGLLLFGETVVFIVLYYLAKKFIYWFLGVVFNNTYETSEFLFNLDNYNRAASIVLFPIVALIAFYPFQSPRFIVILGVLAAAFFYLMVLRRGAIILLKKQFSIFYLFLYLCTLEFLPLLLIYKIVVE